MEERKIIINFAEIIENLKYTNFEKATQHMLIRIGQFYQNQSSFVLIGKPKNVNISHLCQFLCVHKTIEEFRISVILLVDLFDEPTYSLGPHQLYVKKILSLTLEDN